MGILDGIVEWLAEQVMNDLDLVTTSVLGALGCDMTVFLRYFPAAETMYKVFVALFIGLILLNLVWQLFKNFGLGIGLEAEDPEAAFRGGGTLCFTWCACLYRAGGFCYGCVAEHIEYLQILVPDVWRADLPAGHECLVPAVIYQYGWFFYRQPTLFVRR